MKVVCRSSKGESLRPYEYKFLEKSMMGRFGATGFTSYGDGGLAIGQVYLVMGIIIFETYQGYLIDHGGLPSVYPCQLFEVLDDRVSANWHFRVVDKSENIYPFIQSIFGYFELCFDKKAYENLIVEMDKEYQRIYYRRKVELESELDEGQ
jgi:hypothetical protein